MLATVKPPGQLTFVGVTGVANDRTFVLDAIAATAAAQVNKAPQGRHTWFLLRVAPGTSHPATLTRLPIAALDNSDQIEGLALSPDAGTLAVLYRVNVSLGSAGPFRLQTFSLSTGKALRTWTASGHKVGVVEGPDQDNTVGLAWTADGRTLAFEFPPSTWPDYERTLNVTGNGGNLLADSRSVLAIPGDQDYCVSLLLASDGRTMVCGTMSSAPGGCPQQEPEFDLYSTETGRLTRVLYRYRVNCAPGMASVVWAGADGTAIGVLPTGSSTKNRTTPSSTVGLLTAGKFTPLHVSIRAGSDANASTLAF